MREVIDYMELKKVPPGSYVIREGDSGEQKCIDYPTDFIIIIIGQER